MANELKLTLAGTLVNGSLRDRIEPGTLQVTQAVKGAQQQVVTVTSSAAVTLSSTNITTLGWAFAVNLDATNWVSLGISSSGLIKFGRVEPGEWACLRLSPGAVYQALASTTGAASCLLEWRVYND